MNPEYKRIKYYENKEKTKKNQAEYVKKFLNKKGKRK